MSHVKAGGAVRQHAQGSRPGKKLGLKKSSGQQVKAGQIILRQRGAKYKAGKNVRSSADQTIFALIDGTVSFGQRLGRTTVSVTAA